MINKDRKDWKALLLPMAAIQAKSTVEHCYALTGQQTAVLLALAQYVGWYTRWDSPDGRALDATQREWVREFAGNLYNALTMEECSMKDCCPYPELGDVRIVDGVPQWSIDGGAHWVDLDMQTGETTTPPPDPVAGATDDEKMCNASANATKVINELYIQTFGALSNALVDTFTTLLRFLADLGPRIISSDVHPYGNLVWVDTHSEDFTLDQFTTDELSEDSQHDLLCLLYENASMDGQIVRFDWESVTDNVITDLGADPGAAVFTLLSYIGPDGLDRAGGVGNEVGNCETCGLDECEFIDSLTGGLGPHTHIIDGSAPFSANWLDGRGVRGTYEDAAGHTGVGRIRTTLETTVPHIQGAAFYVDLGTDCVLTTVKLWAKKAMGAGNFTITAKYRRSDNNGNGTNTLNVTDTNWQELSFTGASGTSRYILFYLERVTDTDIAYVDDIRINVP